MFQPSQKLKTTNKVQQVSMQSLDTSLPYQSIQQKFDNSQTKTLNYMLQQKIQEAKDKDQQILALQTQNNKLLSQFSQNQKSTAILQKELDKMKHNTDLLTDKLLWMTKQLNLRDTELKIAGQRKSQINKLEICHLVKDFYVPKLNITKEELQLINTYLTE